jgi:Peptidase family M28
VIDDAGADLALLRALAARPRFTGTPPLALARDVCASRLRALGFRAVEQPFRYSTLPARFGMPAIGLASIVLLASVEWIASQRPWASGVALALVALAVLLWLVRWLGGPRPISLDAACADGANLVGTRDGGQQIWLVAHLDSKSQRYPLALRAVGAWLTILAWGGLLVTLAAAAAGRSWPYDWWILATGACGGSLLALASTGNASPGAVDNASGVAAVLAAAGRLGPALPVGILLTDAEEMGLAGAHQWGRRQGPAVAINCDTIDDHGPFTLLTWGRPPAVLAHAAERAARTTNIPLRVRRLPAGVLTDGVALARAGWTTATLSRATAGTLFRIHTRRDSVENLEGSGIEAAAALLDAMVRELL